MPERERVARVAADGGGMSALEAIAEVAKLRPISEMHEAEWNPRVITDERLRDLRKSMDASPEHLWARPLILMEDGTVIAGNHRLQAARLDPPIKQLPSVVFSGLTETEAQTIALRDNQGYAVWDDGSLSAILNHLTAEGIDTVLTGFSGEDVSEILNGFSSGSSGGGGGGSSAEPEPEAAPEQWTAALEALDGATITAVDHGEMVDESRNGLSWMLYLKAGGAVELGAVPERGGKVALRATFFPNAKR